MREGNPEAKNYAPGPGDFLIFDSSSLGGICPGILKLKNARGESQVEADIFILQPPGDASSTQLEKEMKNTQLIRSSAWFYHDVNNKKQLFRFTHPVVEIIDVLSVDHVIPEV